MGGVAGVGGGGPKKKLKATVVAPKEKLEKRQLDAEVLQEKVSQLMLAPSARAMQRQFLCLTSGYLYTYAKLRPVDQLVGHTRQDDTI